jgi:hypothetical protein
MNFTTINELVGNTRGRINQLNEILDVLLSNYRTASEIIDNTVDRRQLHLEQLIELNQTLSNFVDTHPAIHIDKTWKGVTDTITALAMEGVHIDGQTYKKH